MTNDSLRKSIEQVINLHSAENASNTPDFILAEYLMNCLSAFDWATKQRDAWYGQITESVEEPIGDDHED